jgi:hypothetical protein
MDRVWQVVTVLPMAKIGYRAIGALHMGYGQFSP